MADRPVRIITKRTAVPGKIPTGTTGTELNFIKSGELASNLADKKLFSFDGSNVFEFGSNSFLGLTGGTIIGNLNVSGVFSALTIGSSGNCISDIYVSNIHSCSSLNVNPNDEGNVYFGSTSAVTIDVLNSRLGIGTGSPSEKLDIIGRTKTVNLQVTSGATNNYVLTSDSLGNATWKPTQIPNNVVVGTGTTNYLPKWTSVSGLSSTSSIYDDGSNVGIGTITPTAKLQVSNSDSNTTTALFSGSGQNILRIVGSGSTNPIFTIQGSSGELFSVNDSLIGSLFSVNDISGLPILEAFSDNTVLMGSYQAPSLNSTVKKTLTAGVNSIYLLPTSAYTGAFFDYTLMGAGGARAGNIMSIWSGSTTQYTDVSTNDIGSTTGVNFSVVISGSSLVLQASATTSGWTLKTIIRGI